MSQAGIWSRVMSHSMAGHVGRCPPLARCVMKQPNAR